MAKRVTLADVVAALKEHGWRQTGRGVFAPNEPLVLTTPDHIPDAWWGLPTYTDYRVLSVSAVKGRPAHYWTSTGAPWAGARDTKVTAAKAIEFIEETTRLVAETKGAEA
ncbi:hypothetical protein [Streptomyces asiaticus]|uniref:hypothetical protein n=1 Tax=Streptomyces asiaticus TaxID=114695 RepID=UPI001BAE0D18|nr:hypothetical protein [Streptomyces asiaticus]